MNAAIMKYSGQPSKMAYDSLLGNPDYPHAQEYDFEDPKPLVLTNHLKSVSRKDAQKKDSNGLSLCCMVCRMKEVKGSNWKW